MSGEKTKYVTVSLPIGIAQSVDSLMEELGYWPSRSAFVREASLEKIREEGRGLMELRGPGVEASQAERGERPRRGTNPGDQLPKGTWTDRSRNDEK